MRKTDFNKLIGLSEPAVADAPSNEQSDDNPAKISEG